MKTSTVRKILGPIAADFTAMNTGSWRLERPVVNLEICIGCAACERNCPADVITVTKEPILSVRIDMNYCKGCGICSEICPKKSISMKNEKGAEE